MGTADNFLRNAERCERYARTCPLERDRDAFSQMADDWRGMADRIAGERPSFETAAS